MRKNATNERRLTLLAIEGISTSKIARERGLGATLSQIKEYTGFTRIAVATSLRFLERNGLIRQGSKREWHIKETPPDNFCMEHGLCELFCGRCLECIQKDGKLK